MMGKSTRGPFEARDFNGDGRNELLVWAYFGSHEQLTRERIHQFDDYRFDGEHLTTHYGDGHQTDARHLRPDELTPRTIGED